MPPHPWPPASSNCYKPCISGREKAKEGQTEREELGKKVGIIDTKEGKKDRKKDRMRRRRKSERGGGRGVEEEGHE